jgi:branched-chain amino acid transport system ATP-binding protein
MAVCQELHVLDFGRIIASGTPAAIRQDRKVQEAYLGYSEEGPADDPPTSELPAVPEEVKA